MSPERRACVASGEQDRRVSPRKKVEDVAAAMATTMTEVATTPATARSWLRRRMLGISHAMMTTNMCVAMPRRGRGRACGSGVREVGAGAVVPMATKPASLLIPL